MLRLFKCVLEVMDCNTVANNGLCLYISFASCDVFYQGAKLLKKVVFMHGSFI